MTDEELADRLWMAQLSRKLDKERINYRPYYVAIAVTVLDEILRRANAGEPLPKPEPIDA